MGVQVFKESQVRKAIINKAPIHIKSGKRSDHDTGFLLVNDIKVSHLRIPNSHSDEFKKGKAANMAKKLHLKKDEYNEFVSCNMKPKEYLKLLNKKFSDKEKETEVLSKKGTK